MQSRIKKTILWAGTRIFAILLVYGSLTILTKCIFSKAMSDFFAPNTPESSIHNIKKYIGFDFGNDYEITEHISRNAHPDRPLTVTFILPDTTLREMISYISKLDPTEKIIHKEDVVYREKWTKIGNDWCKDYSATHEDENLPFFFARLYIDTEKCTLHYQESGI